MCVVSLNFFNFFSVFISFEISFVPQLKWWHRSDDVIPALYNHTCQSCSSRLRPYLYGMIPWNTRSSNIFNPEITYDKNFLLLFSWQLYHIVYCCKIIIFSWYFIWSWNLLVTISYAVISFFFVFVDFILAIFLFHPILIKIMIEFQKFIILIKYCFYCFLFVFNFFS